MATTQVATQANGAGPGPVLVAKGSASRTGAGCCGDLRHRHPEQPMLLHQGGGGGQDRLADLVAVRVDGVIPQFQHWPRCCSSSPRFCPPTTHAA